VAVRTDLENRILPTTGGRTHLRLTIVGGTMRPAIPAPPATYRASYDREPPPRESVSVWVHLDASGSMSGESMRAAAAAAHTLVRRLHPDDRIGIVSNGHTRRVHRALRRVGDSIDAHRAIDSVVAGGARPAGGPPWAARKGPRGELPLVLWVTDGAGFADAPARRHADAAPVVALVLGDAASADDLEALRSAPGLDAHHVPDSTKLAPAVSRALYAHRAAIVHEVEVTVSSAPGVRIHRVYGGAGSSEGAGLVARFPALGRGEERVVLVELEAEGGAAGESVALADYSVAYRAGSSSELAHVGGIARARWANEGEDTMVTRDRGVARSVLAARTGAALVAAGAELARNDVAAAGRALEDHEELLAIAASSLGEAFARRDAEVVGAYAHMVRRAPAMFDEGARRRFAARMVFEGDGRMRR
jgi:hypothetical protein